MHIDKDWVPAVSAASGAGGAVLAQIVAAYFTGRREKRKAKEARVDKRAELFRDEKKELFVKSLKLHEALIDDHRDFIMKVAAGETAVTWPTYVFRADEWNELVAEFNLLAPEICPYLNKTQQLYKQIEIHFMSAKFDEAKAVLKEVRGRQEDLVRLMVGSLGTALDKATRDQMEKDKKAETKAAKKSK